MSEIKIEKKKSVWPWIFLIVAILAILVYVFAFDDEGKETNERQEDRTEQRKEELKKSNQEFLNNSEVTAYINFIKEDSDSMGLDHEFTKEALLKLTNATTAMAKEIDYDIQKDIEELRTYSNKITKEPFKTTHANSIRKSADILANVLQNIQQKAFSNLNSEADKVKDAATAIKPDMQTLNQKEDIKNFFRTSANLLEKMNTNSPKK